MLLTKPQLERLFKGSPHIRRDFEFLTVAKSYSEGTPPIVKRETMRAMLREVAAFSRKNGLRVLGLYERHFMRNTFALTDHFVFLARRNGGLDGTSMELE